ncbi:MAG: hypothetical protein DDT22_00165 [candidate division WS2 bacterium]|nr:hypothetical protein [Candidatus Lithacetigena glycinireducens]MBT9174509.1 hypothetical protein [Candidatus Lithacetigena glycinireducens]
MKALVLSDLLSMIKGAYDELAIHKDEVNALNVFPVPDGDTGINMVMTMQSALEEISRNNPKTIKELSLAFRRGSLMGARGNSGVILSQIILGIGNVFDDENQIDGAILKRALKQGSDSAYKAVMRPVEGTMLTIIRSLAEGAQGVVSDDIAKILLGSIREADIALQKTPDMLPVLKEAGVVDAGGLGLIYIFKGMLKALTGESLPEIVLLEPSKFKELLPVGVEEDLEYAYCTELLINNPNKTTKELETILTEIGGSLLVVGDASMIKFHIHSNHPDRVLAYALSTGEIQDIKIDNMKLQHREYLYKKAETPSVVNPTREKYSIIAVVLGRGMEEIYKNLGAKVVITGGQTMNPSVVEIVSSIEKTYAENIFLIINNKNIKMAAEEAIKIASQFKVYLVNTNHMVEGISALFRFNPDLEPEENYERMKESIAKTWVAELTVAQRNGSLGETSYNLGDYISITSDDEILCSGKDLNEVVLSTLLKSPCQEGSIVTLYAGEGVEENWILREEIIKRFKVEVELYYGGQSHYQYFISVE